MADFFVPTPLEVTDDFPLDNNMFMTFHYEEGELTRFGYVISAKIFYGFVRYNNEGLLKEEDVTFPTMFLHGVTRRALVHYVKGEKFTCFVPVFPTKEEIEKYSASFRR